MAWTIEVRHNFETAHRLSTPDSPEKCQSIHGHSWWVTVTIEGDELDSGDMLVEFGAFKKAWRGWLDANLDHALVIRSDDPVGDALLAVIPNQRLFRMDSNPTTEAIAALLFERAKTVLAAVPKSADCHISRVHVQETRVNAAGYQA